MKEELEELEQFSSSTRVELTLDLIKLYSTMFANYILSRSNALIREETEDLWESFLKDKNLND